MTPDDKALMMRAFKALDELRIYAEMSDDCCHGTLSTTLVRSCADDELLAVLNARLDDAPQPVRELPPLPAGIETYVDGKQTSIRYTGKQMRDYACAIEAATLERAATLVEFESNNLELATAIRALKEA